jgi:hypothetical protein
MPIADRPNPYERIEELEFELTALRSQVETLTRELLAVLNAV